MIQLNSPCRRQNELALEPVPSASLEEPTLHFFLIGLLFFVVHQEIVGDPRTIVVDPALKSDLARRFRDQNGRAPNAAELDTALDAWKREGALSRGPARKISSSRIRRSAKRSQTGSGCARRSSSRSVNPLRPSSKPGSIRTRTLRRAAPLPLRVRELRERGSLRRKRSSRVSNRL